MGLTSSLRCSQQQGPNRYEVGGRQFRIRGARLGSLLDLERYRESLTCGFVFGIGWICYLRRMQASQVSIWVPIVVGIIGLVGIVAGQLVNAWREDRRWRREREREELRWKREAEAEAVKRAHDSLIDWRNRRISTYGEYLESIHGLIKMATKATMHSATIDGINSFTREYHECEKIYNDIGERVRLLASDEIVFIMKYNALTMQLPVPVTVHVPKPVLMVPLTAEEARVEAEDDMRKIRKELQEHVTHAWAYYHDLTNQMRADLGAAPLPRE